MRLTCLTVCLKLVKELKSTVSGSELQHVVTRSLKKFARTLWVFWHLQSLNLCSRVTWQVLKTNRSSRLTSTKLLHCFFLCQINIPLSSFAISTNNSWNSVLSNLILIFALSAFSFTALTLLIGKLSGLCYNKNCYLKCYLFLICPS